MEIFASVRDGRIVEFPVTLEIIQTRGHTPFNYTPVVFGSKPSYNSQIARLSQDAKLSDGVVKVFYNVVNLTLAELLATFKKTKTTALDLSELSEIQLSTAQTLVINHAEAKVEALANRRGYNSIDTALGRYSLSSSPKYRSESDFIRAALDKAWADAEDYFAKIVARQLPVPTSVEEVDAVIVVADWPEPEAPPTVIVTPAEPVTETPTEAPTIAPSFSVNIGESPFKKG